MKGWIFIGFEPHSERARQVLGKVEGKEDALARWKAGKSPEIRKEGSPPTLGKRGERGERGRRGYEASGNKGCTRSSEQKPNFRIEFPTVGL